MERVGVHCCFSHRLVLSEASGRVEWIPPLTRFARSVGMTNSGDSLGMTVSYRSGGIYDVPTGDMLDGLPIHQKLYENPPASWMLERSMVPKPEKSLLSSSSDQR